MGMTVYMTVREVTAMARCEHKSVRRAISAGRLRAFRPTNKLLIREEDAEAWIEGWPAIAGSPAKPSPGRGPLRPTMRSQRVGSVAELREIERKAVRA
jgi:excisionase family DNA binding protein